MKHPLKLALHILLFGIAALGPALAEETNVAPPPAHDDALYAVTIARIRAEPQAMWTIAALLGCQPNPAEAPPADLPPREPLRMLIVTRDAYQFCLPKR